MKHMSKYICIILTLLDCIVYLVTDIPEYLITATMLLCTSFILDKIEKNEK